MPTSKEIEAAARALCSLAGHEPNAIGDPPNDERMPTLAHRFPRWMMWCEQARVALGAAEVVRNQTTK